MLFTSSTSTKVYIMLPELKFLSQKDLKKLKKISMKLPDQPEPSTTSISIKVPDGKKAVLVDDTGSNKKNFLNPYTTIGGLNNMNTILKERHDIFDLLGSVSRPAYALFNELKNVRDPKTNECHYSTRTFDAGKKEVFSRRLRELKKLEIIKRRKIGVYLINPNLIKPEKDYDIVAALWLIMK